MHVEASPMRAGVLIPGRGTACCAPACPDADFKRSDPRAGFKRGDSRDGFERVPSLGGRSFSSDISQPRLWALAPEEMPLCL